MLAYICKYVQRSSTRIGHLLNTRQLWPSLLAAPLVLVTRAGENYPVSLSGKSAEHAHIEHVIATKLPASPIYAYLLSDVRVISASRGHVVCRLHMLDVHMNSGGGLHGSVSATIIDWMGGIAICSQTFKESSGVSVDIHATYLSSVKTGDEIEIEGLASKVGSSMAYTTVNIFKVEGGQRGRPVVSGSHTKFVRQ